MGSFTPPHSCSCGSDPPSSTQIMSWTPSISWCTKDILGIVSSRSDLNSETQQMLRHTIQGQHVVPMAHQEDLSSDIEDMLHGFQSFSPPCWISEPDVSSVPLNVVYEDDTCGKGPKKPHKSHLVVGDQLTGFVARSRGPTGTSMSCLNSFDHTWHGFAIMQLATQISLMHLLHFPRLALSTPV